MEPSAQIRMCAQTVAQIVFHEGNNAMSAHLQLTQ
jgi:hypothetical protein